MIDRIQSNVSPSHSHSVNQISNQLQVPSEANHQTENRSAELSLSSDAKILQQITQAASDASDVRNEVIQEIQAQIKTGTYQINADALAEKLLPFLK